jgi:hypothetical protein
MLAKEDFNFSKLKKNILFCVPIQTKFESENITKRNKILKNAECYTAVLCSIPASSDTVESEGRQMCSVEIKYLKRKKIPLFFSEQSLKPSKTN